MTMGEVIKFPRKLTPAVRQHRPAEVIIMPIVRRDDDWGVRIERHEEDLVSQRTRRRVQHEMEKLRAAVQGPIFDDR